MTKRPPRARDLTEFPLTMQEIETMLKADRTKQRKLKREQKRMAFNRRAHDNNVEHGIRTKRDV